MEKDIKGKNNSKNLKKTGNISYPAGDFLVRLKNACMANKRQIVVRRSNLVEAIAKTLQEEGYLEEVKKEGSLIEVRLKYLKKEPVLTDLSLVSKPGLRVYMTRENIDKLKGPKFLLLSTSYGVMSSRDALKKGVGGEVIAEIL